MIEKAPLSPSRVDFIEFFNKGLGKFFKNPKAIIDVGCGKLFFYHLLVAIGAKGLYLGIDIDPSVQSFPNKNLKPQVVKIDLFKFKTNRKFDAAACLWVLEHVREDQKALLKLYNLLKSDGVLILAVPSIWSWPFELGQHGLHYYTQEKITKMATGVGFKIQKLYQASGFWGAIFMIFYNWPRLVLLVVGFLIYQLLILLNLTKKSWRQFSLNLVGQTVYRYHRSKAAVSLHNQIVNFLVDLDNYFKIFPASYILILQK